jgi:hypothetical protein
MSDFADYVNGKTIAVVGPAPAPYDQTAEVEAHDIVYRASYGFTVPEEDIRLQSMADLGTDWYRPGVFIPGYGNRVDMAFYNAGATWQATRGELDQVLADLDWAVFKVDGVAASELTNVRHCNRPPCKVPGTESQITAMLWDLTFFKPAKVTVFGADFYTGDLENWYDPAYVRPGLVDLPVEIVANVESIMWHDQAENRRIVQLVRQHGWLVGDARYLRALDMTFEEYNGILEAQLTRAYAAHRL